MTDKKQNTEPHCVICWKSREAALIRINERGATGMWACAGLHRRLFPLVYMNTDDALTRLAVLRLQGKALGPKP